MSVPAEALNDRLAIKAAIRRATRAARDNLLTLDAASLEALRLLYEDVAAQLRADIEGYADDQGNLRLEVLNELLAQVEERLAALGEQRNAQLLGALPQAAAIGAAPFAADAARAASVTRLADEAVRFTIAFQAEDGLQLSDRLWRLDVGAREAVGQAVREAVAQGWDASRAARTFIDRGAAVPPDVRARLGAARADRVARAVGAALLNEDDGAYARALRVFRTEINRAHGQAYLAGVASTHDAAGVRFLLSPRHPRPDICDMHARANLYGLGAGVYPVDRCPWPAHPNTFSTTEIVFTDEVSDADRAARTSRLDWLRAQPPDLQAAVLGGERKQRAFAAGWMAENEIATPWRVLKDVYAQRGLILPPA